MPAEQRGSTYRTAHGWGVRWIEVGRRQYQSGFTSQTEARRWWEATVRPRLLGIAVPVERPDPTLEAFFDEFLLSLEARLEPRTVATHRVRLRYVTRSAFGQLTLRELEPRAAEIAAWRGKLPEGMRYPVIGSLRQALDCAVRWGYMTQNPAKLAGPNPQPKIREVHPFTHTETDAIAIELGAVHGALPVFAAETGLRPEEWIAPERRDWIRDKKAILVERTFSDTLKPYGKTARSRRRVPLSPRAEAALDMIPPRLDTRLLFPAARGGYLSLHNWRQREWYPALEAAGLAKRGPYALRHTFVTNALAAGVPTFDVARYAGTSVAMIERTYGHLAHGSDDAFRTRLAEFSRASGVDLVSDERDL